VWTPPPRAPDAEALYAAAEADRACRPENYTLGRQTLLAAAFAKAPLPPNDNGDWKEGFDLYVDSAREEGRLNALGQRNMAGAAIGKLQARVKIAETLAAHPDIRTRKIDRPIFIIGGWRTGTTLLQRLLDGLPGLRGVMPSELSVPWRFRGLDTAARAALIAAGEGAHQRLHTLNPQMQAIHPSGGRLAEECVLAMGTDFRNWGFTSTLRSPSYAAWMLRQDMGPSYHRYADTLRMLQDDSGRRFVLKAPAHTAALPALWAAFPDAVVLHLHRDVVETVTSGASLFAVFRSTYSDHVDPAELGRYQLDMTAEWFARAMAAREAAPERKVIDIAFRELVADPAALAENLCRALDIPWTDLSAAAARQRLADLNRQHGAHKYTPADFGLTAGEIRERLSAYSERFGLG
jgi:hypothetical protein